MKKSLVQLVLNPFFDRFKSTRKSDFLHSIHHQVHKIDALLDSEIDRYFFERKFQMSFRLDVFMRMTGHVRYMVTKSTHSKLKRK